MIHLNIFFNHGEGMIYKLVRRSHSTAFRIVNFKNFFKHGERMIIEVGNNYQVSLLLKFGILMGEFFAFNEVTSKFLRPNVRTVKKGQGSLRSLGPVIWNSMLPDKVKSSPNLSIFKDRVASWIPENCCCCYYQLFLLDYSCFNTVNVL